MALASYLLGSWPSSESPKKLAKDLELLLSLDDAAFSACLRTAFEAEEIGSEQAVAALFEKLETESGRHPADLVRVLGLLSWFVRSHSSEQVQADTVEQWIEDLVRLKVLEKGHADIARDRLSAIKEQSIAFQDKLLRFETTQAVVPSLVAVMGTVELRAILRRQYRWPDDPNEFVPQIDGTTLVYLLKLKLDSGFPEELVFQASSDQVEMMISNLVALTKQADALSRLRKDG